MSSHPYRKTKPSTIRARSRNKKLAVIGIVAAIAIVIVAFVMFSQGNSPTNVSPSSSPSSSPSASPSGPTKVLLQTNMGNITIQLRDDKPITAGNFKNLVQKGTYDNTIFHRVVVNFMIQGGDPTGTGFGDPSIPTIADEIGSNNRNERGTIAMANTGQPNSASSQFFINVVDNGPNVIDRAGTKFDSAYTVFGKVIQGMDVVDAISNVAVGPNSQGENSKPLQNVTIIKATILP